MPITASDLKLPARHGLRLLVSTNLRAAAEASNRLGDGDDDSALHDFRVAVRRLRVWLEAFDHELGDVRPRDVRRLHKIGRATSSGRDLEVQLEWLRRAARRRGRRRQEGAQWVARVLADRQVEAAKKLLRLVERRFHKVRARIASVLETDTRTGKHPAETLAQAIGRRMRQDAPELRNTLAQVRAVTDDELIHAARTAAKRLRYLLEPVALHLADGRHVLAQLKSLQDDLGAVHDHQVMAREVAALAGRSGALQERRDIALMLGAFGERIDVQDDTIRGPADSGALRALARRLRRDLDAAFARAQERWLTDAGVLDAEIQAIVEQVLAEEPSTDTAPSV